MSGDVVERLRVEADKVLKGGPIWGEGETVATIKEAADLITQLTKERDAALDNDWVAAPAYAAKVEQCRQYRDRAETAERLLAEARAALGTVQSYWLGRYFNGCTNSDSEKINAAFATLTNGGDNGR